MFLDPSMVRLQTPRGYACGLLEVTRVDSWGQQIQPLTCCILFLRLYEQIKG